MPAAHLHAHTRPPHQATMAAITDATIYPLLSAPRPTRPYNVSTPVLPPCLSVAMLSVRLRRLKTELLSLIG